MKNAIKILDKITEYAAYGLVFIIPFSKAGIEIFGTTAIVAWVFLRLLPLLPNGNAVASNSSIRGNNPVFLPLAVFILINFLSCVTSVSFGHSIKALFAKTLEYLLFFLIIADIFSRDKRRIYILISVMLISAALICLDGLIQYLTGFDLILRSRLEYGRMSASFLNPNDFGNYLVVFAPIFLGLTLGKKILLRYRVITLSSFFLLLLCVILCYSRASYLGFLVALLFVAFLKGKKIFLFFIFILIIGFFLLPANAKSRMKEIDSLGKVTADQRTVMWQEALSIIEDWPILGTGLNTYTLVGPRYKIHPEGGIYPHNSYLHMAAEIGITGLAAFFWFLFEVFRRAIACFRQARDGLLQALLLGSMAGLAGFLVNAFFDTTLYAMRLITVFWITTGIMIAVCGMVERESGKEAAK